MSRAYKLIADSRHSNNQFRPFRIQFQFLPQTSDVHIHGSSKHALVVSPYRTQQFGSRDRGPSLLDQIAQQLELPAGNVHRLAFSSHLASTQIHADGTKVMHASARMNGNTAEKNLYSSQQLGRFEGLGHIVVATQL